MAFLSDYQDLKTWIIRYSCIHCHIHFSAGSGIYFRAHARVERRVMRILCVISGINSQYNLSSVQFSHSLISDFFVTPWTTACFHSITNSQRLLKLMSTNSQRLLNSCPPTQWSHPIISSSVLPFSASLQSNESGLCIRWPKCWSFSFSISPSNKYSELISLMMNWFDLLAVQATLKSLLQHHSSKASILQCSAFFTAQLSHQYKLRYFISVVCVFCCSGLPWWFTW